MAGLVEICKLESSLSSVQIDLLGQLSPCLPFVADLTRANLRLYVPSKTVGTHIMAFEVSPGMSASIHGESTPAILTDRTVEPMVKETFRTGKALNQWQESETDGAGIRSYAITDYSGTTIGVAVLSFRLLLPMDEYTHLLHVAGTLLRCGRKFSPEVYRRLSSEDGILVADKYHRIVFADEIVRHIYRSLGAGSLVGRHLFDEELKSIVDRESRAKKLPWEREINAGERILRETRLDFTEGGNGLGHLVILSDITEQRRREQDAKVQEALMQRIQELEEELESVKDSLSTRKLLDRAKGILMAELGLTEEESYRRMQRYAMMKRTTMKEVAEAVLRQSGHLNTGSEEKL